MKDLVNVTFTKSEAEALIDLLDRVYEDFEYDDKKDLVDGISLMLYMKLEETKWLNSLERQIQNISSRFL